jgi:hypothetical protein
MRALEQLERPIENQTSVLLVQLHIQSEKYSTLHQLVQHGVITDSQEVATQLLSVQTAYPAAYQLALDMLARLGRYHAIITALLDRHNVGTLFSRDQCTIVHPCLVYRYYRRSS